MFASAGRAVFLSYASQDAEAAKRIAEALRAAGVEVWLDQEGGLVGGDVWDRKIREQIGSCTLFVPLISANTQARHEGYFRLEWKLAEDRSHLIAKGKPFIVPVSVDGTTERGALVPDAFLAVQWTKLPGGEAPAAFVARVRKLLGIDSANAVPVADRAPTAPIQNSGLSPHKAELSPAVRRPPDVAYETFERQRPLWRRALPLTAALVVGALLSATVAWRLWPKAAPAPVSRFTHRLPDGQFLRATGVNALAVSPDGRRFVYTTNRGLFLRNLYEVEARLIPGTEGTINERATSPFFSPDGQSVGFVYQRQVKRIAVGGGTSVVICELSAFGRDGQWTPDGTILIVDRPGILRVAASGGKPSLVIPAPNGKLLTGPQLLPDGDTVLMVERPNPTSPDSNEGKKIVAQKISTGARKILVEGGIDPRFIAPGHLVYVVGNVLMGVAFDSRQLAITGTAVPLVPGVLWGVTRYSEAASYAVAADGTLIFAYSPVVAAPNTWQLGLSDRAGKLTPLPLPAGPYEAPRASPDGTRLAVCVEDPKGSYIAIFDLDGKTSLRPLTIGGNSRYPVWSRDGQRVTFQSDREGDLAIFWQRADGSAKAERLTKPAPDTAHVPASWSPNDENLLFTVVPSMEPNTAGELWNFARSSQTAAPLGDVKEKIHADPMFSPDGRWVAYSSRNERSGLFVQPFPATGALHQLPRQEGDNPPCHGFWSPDGKMLYFGPGPARLAVVSVTTQPAVAFGNQTEVPRPFRSGSPSYPRPFDILPDGRFVGRIAPGQATVGEGTGEPEIRIVLNWTEELKRLVPVK